MKKAVLNLMRMGGAFAVMRHLNQTSSLIVTYHRFCSESDNRSYVGTFAKAFEEQLAYLSSCYKVVTLTQLIEHLNSENGRERSLPLAAVTIDDGYRDAYEIAYPILRRRNIPALLYVVTDFIDSQSWVWTDKMRFLVLRARSQTLSLTIAGKSISVVLDDTTSRIAAASYINSLLKTLSDEEKDEMLYFIALSLDVNLPSSPPHEYGGVTRKQIREMDANRLSIGSHTVSHPIMTNIDQSRLRFELRESKSRLEQILKHNVDHFCYPNGNYNELVVNETVNAGYQSAVTVDSGLNTKGRDCFKLLRIHTDDSMAHFLQATSGMDDLKNRLRTRL